MKPSAQSAQALQNVYSQLLHDICLDDGKPLRLVPQHQQRVAWFDAKYPAGLFGDYDLPLFTHFHCAENMLPFFSRVAPPFSFWLYFSYLL